MNKFDIPLKLKNIPKLDETFCPIYAFNQAFLKTAKKPLTLALKDSRGQMAIEHTFIHDTPEKIHTDRYYIERLIKTLLWMKGGYRIYVSGDKDIYEYLREVYCEEGLRKFDFDFMAGVYEHPFEVIYTDNLPESKVDPKAVGGHLEGCRIGFDAGGSDRKVSAVMDGETVYSEETVWFPKEHADPQYHYDGIVAALRSAASHLPRVDAIGVSSAGIYINNRAMVASLFIKIPKDVFNQEVKDIYIRAIRDTFGDVPYAIINDGDVSALAGAMSLNDTSVLGIAMGTSQAGGFVDERGRITGWLNELAFVPVDVSFDAALDEWSGDIGCGVKYFSQDAVIRLAERAGLTIGGDLSLAEKLVEVQKLMDSDDPRAVEIFHTIGVYLGHTLPFYYSLYRCRNVLLLGRVMSGKGGDIILNTAQKVLEEEYPLEAGSMRLKLPDEKFRRVGQSMAAASLPELYNL